jgi:hypothetical protein
MAEEKQKRNSPIRSFKDKEQLRDELVKAYIEEAKLLQEGEKFNASEFCKKHNLQQSLFYEINSLASLKTKEIYDFDFPEIKGEKSYGKKYAVVGKKSNIIIKPPHVAILNKEREEDQKFKPGDKFEVAVDGDIITLTKI